MTVLDNVLGGLQSAFSAQNLLFLLIGVALGVVVGILPGLGPTAGIAILIPMTLGMDPTAAVIMLAAIYYGAMYGGSITAILINLPGESASVAATFDGYPLARQGRAGPALVMQAVANFVGGISAVILLSVLIGPISGVARSFGPSELLLIVLLGLVTIIAVVGQDKVKGAISALFGFSLGTVGVDLASGASRFTFNEPSLISGVSFVALVIGLFGIAEVLHNISDGQHRVTGAVIAPSMRKDFLPSRQDWRESRFTFPRATGVGFLVGLVPGAGASVASFIGYALEKSVSKVKHKFGKGAMPGLVAVESSISASSPGAMVPMLALGIPGSAATAVLLGAFVLWGLTPGPQLMTEHPDFAWGVIGSLYLGNIALLVFCVAAIPLFVQVLKVPYAYLIPSIIVLCVIGTYAVGASFIDLGIVIALGVVGTLMKRHGYSPAAAVVAFVLGPLAENSLRQTMIISSEDPTFILGRPYSIGLGVLLLAILAGSVAMRVPAVRDRVRRRRPAPDDGDSGDSSRTGSDGEGVRR
ncbi:MAG: tripartite tricarboxylate transporter permease [Actinophytocola sp.]|uniref:tripartite tricarboxylate transporter permease n=1 Tax=Actinophytocola sp. TaxID=1872138 RepID=UPI00132A27AF|nr:tripartite tricarboxylate transporter permease [Actinophytocola sp.]MPZ79713.1 tripartite tricarboxylate transporter permease [Actinophytocola sp.]